MLSNENPKSPVSNRAHDRLTEINTRLQAIAERLELLASNIDSTAEGRDANAQQISNYTLLNKMNFADDYLCTIEKLVGSLEYAIGTASEDVPKGGGNAVNRRCPARRWDSRLIKQEMS